MTYILSSVVLAIIFVGLLLMWKSSLKPTIYRFRSVFILSLAFMNIGAIGEVIFSGTMSCSNSEETVGVFEMIKLYPIHFSLVLIALIIAMGFLMFISNISLMKHEGMRPKNMIGTFLGVIFVIGTVVIYIISQYLWSISENLEGIKKYIFEFLPLFFYSIIDYCECIVLGICAMGWVASKQKPTYDKDYIIILGCLISKTGGLLPLIKARANAAVHYAWEQEIASGKPVKYVPSGGQGPDEIMSEGSAMELYLITHGAEPEEVFPERESKNTYENIKFSKSIIDEMNPEAKIAFATTNYHVLRSGMIAHKQGFEVEGIGSKTKWYFWPNGFAREVIAIFTMTKKKHIMNAMIIAVICAIISIF